MSAQVTIQRTFTTTTTSAILINVGFMKSVPGILKILQIILGCIVVGIIGHYISYNTSEPVPELFFLLVGTTCLITTTLIVFSCLFSIATASILPRTLFEISYHIIAFLLYISAAVTLLVRVTDDRKHRVYYYDAKLAAASIGIANAALYLLSTIYSLKAFRKG